MLLVSGQPFESLLDLKFFLSRPTKLLHPSPHERVCTGCTLAFFAKIPSPEYPAVAGVASILYDLPTPDEEQHENLGL